MALTKLDPNVIGTDSSGTSKLSSAGGSAQLYSTGLFAIANNSANNLAIASNGYVGVGTTSPSYLLHVKPASGSPVVTAEGVGTAQAGFFAAIGADSGSYPGFRTYQGATHYWSIHQRGDTNLHLYRESGSGSVIIDSGKVGIGTSTPYSSLQLSVSNMQSPGNTDILPTALLGMSGGGGDYLSIGQYANSHFWMQAGYANPSLAYYNIIMQPLGGKVGVGVTSPTETIDVLGSVHIRNDLSGGQGYTGGYRFAHSGTANTAAYIQQGGNTGDIGMTSGDITAPSGTATMLARTHWGGLALVGYAGTGQQGYRIVAMGYGTSPTVLYSASWVGSATITFSQSDYRLFVSQSTGSAMSFWCVFLGV